MLFFVSDSMFAIGCLMLIILPALGLTAGLLVGGTAGAVAGGFLGFLLATGLLATPLIALVKARRGH